MKNTLYTTPIAASYQQEEKPVLILTHDQRKSIISVGNTAIRKVKKVYGDTIYMECKENWNSDKATHESILKDIFSLFEVRVCNYKGSP